MDEQKFQHERDIALIAERMFREAKQRRWCGEFNEIINELNEKLHVKMVRPPTQHRVTVELFYDALGEIDARERAGNFINGDAEGLNRWYVDDACETM